MIEGNFKDVSLPGLLQFLSAEVNKSYRIRVTSAKHSGEVYICKGTITTASFGLLEGEDALCEFFSWQDGTFGVELLNPQFEIKKNLHLPVAPGDSLADQAAFLSDKNIGLNSVIVASKEFGTPEWRETIKNQPLNREDFLVIGWIKDGRTMRQAMREFDLDIVQATGVLFRLTASKSILIRRTGSKSNMEPGSDPVRIINRVSIERFLTTGAQESAAAAMAKQAKEASSELAIGQDSFVSTAFQGESVMRPSIFKMAQPAKVDAASARPSMESRLRARTSRSNMPKVPTPTPAPPPTANPTPTPTEKKLPAPGEMVTLPPVPLAELLIGQANTMAEVEAALAAINDLSDSNPRKKLGSNYELNFSPPPLPPGSDPMLTAPANAFSDLVDDTVPLLNKLERSTTGSLPLVAFDIERLLKSKFKQTQFGKLALTNPSLDQVRRQTLIEVGQGKTLSDVLTEDTRSPAAVLSSYKYCLDRGYIESNDPVLPLTADLLLGRMEIDQYLLQRRRITGDELRDLTSNARDSGMRLIDLLFRERFLTVVDVETLIREQKRFAPK